MAELGPVYSAWCQQLMAVRTMTCPTATLETTIGASTTDGCQNDDLPAMMADLGPDVWSSKS